MYDTDILRPAWHTSSKANIQNTCTMDHRVKEQNDNSNGIQKSGTAEGHSTEDVNSTNIITDNVNKFDMESPETESNTTENTRCRCSRNIVTFTLAYGSSSMLTSALALYMSSQITTLERQFGLSSGESGIILSCNDIGFLLTVLLFGHFGPRFHIPRLLSMAVVLYGISGLMCSLPPFISGFSSSVDGNSVLNKSEDNSMTSLCKPEGNSSIHSCSSEETLKTERVKWVVVYLGICLGIQGVGKSPRSPLGTLYIDNNTEKGKTGLYLGITTALGMMGPFVALMLGGVFGKLPVDLKHTTMTPEDSRWIGAWWLGFLLFGSLSLLAAIPLATFPRRLPSAPVLNESRLKKIEQMNRESFCDKIKSLPRGLLKVFRCAVFDVCLVATLCLLFGAMGNTIFGPKYLENQFNIPTWKANMILGVEKLGTGIIGVCLGGYITSRLRMNRRKCLKMVVVLSFLTTALSSLEFIFGCENPPVKGPTSVQSCNCEDVTYQAVCGSNGQTFITPCHAGCLNVTDNLYSNCQFVSGDQKARPGICDSGCSFLIPYVAVSMISTLVATMGIMPIYLVFLRSVPEESRALALGILSAAVALLVFIPTPIAFGKIYDSACLIWKTTCGVRGACGLYDIVNMRYRLVALDVGCRGCALLLHMVAFCITTRQDKDDDSDEMNKENADIVIKSI
ncbi:solute carrier organic anion transporter family member 2A1-like [Ylistrum balloti]|uniref:solute carrier organic anion transporter family member 2A1-like n=1 Tax=Ylistrum balloti TaxID=509963 RepID=UPI002905B59A|nr:solute carrier organic anion transporter family member 2A1-like [Ylistrum balloti]